MGDVGQQTQPYQQQQNSSMSGGGRRMSLRSILGMGNSKRSAKSAKSGKKRRGGCSASMSGGSALAGGAPLDMQGGQGMQGGADVLGYDAKSSLGYSMYGGRGSRRRRMSRRRRGKPRAMSAKYFPQGIFRGIMPRMSK